MKIQYNKTIVLYVLKVETNSQIKYTAICRNENILHNQIFENLCNLCVTSV